MFLLLSSIVAAITISVVTFLFLKKVGADDRRFLLRSSFYYIYIRLWGVDREITRRNVEQALRILAEQRKRRVEAKQTATPKAAWRRSFLVDLLLPMAIAKDVQANLDELTPVWVEQHGVRKARLIRAAQIGRIVIGHWSRPLVKIARRLVGL